MSYLPAEAPAREIRFIELNDQIAESSDASREPFDSGIDTGTDSEHWLLILDVTPSQWERIESEALQLPSGWSLMGHEEFISLSVVS